MEEKISFDFQYQRDFSLWRTRWAGQLCPWWEEQRDVHIVTEQAWHGSRSGPSRAHSQQHTLTSQAPPPPKPLHKLGTDGSKREPLRGHFGLKH